MKAVFKTLTVMLLALIFPFSGTAQVEQEQDDSTRQLVVVVKNDGTEYIGYIITQDEREVLLETKTIGRLYIPKHEIKEIRPISPEEIVEKEYIGDPVFGTRYFITTNGFNGKRGDNYIIWDWWGPDIQFTLNKHLTVGIITTWGGIPLIGSVKVGKELSNRTAIGAGLLIGSPTWAAPEAGIFAGYGTFTFGTRANNVNFSLGYGGYTYTSDKDNDIFQSNSSGSAVLGSVASHITVTKKFSFVFDSFLIFDQKDNNTIVNGFVTPGFRMATAPGQAIQFGFTGILAEDELLPFPIPVVGWMRSF